MSKMNEMDLYLKEVASILKAEPDMPVNDVIEIIVDIYDLTPGDGRNIIYFWNQRITENGSTN